MYLTAAWISRWVWVKKIPSFKQLKKQLEPKKIMTDEQLLAQVKALNDMFGGEVVDKKPTN